MDSSAVEVVRVSRDNLPDVEAFLARYPETTLFLSSNLALHGPDLGDGLNSGNFKFLAQAGEILAVFCLPRRGGILAETGGRTDLAEPIVEACLHESIPVTGVIGEWRAAEAIEQVLVRSHGFVESFRSREGLYRLELGEHAEFPARSPHVRLLAPADFDEWEPQNRQYLEEQGLPSQGTTEERRELFEQTAGAWYWWGYVTDGRLCATLTLNAVHGLTGQIGAVFTAPDYRRRGIARALLNAALSDCWRVHGLTRLVLFTGEANVAARSLYESAGFERVGEFALLFGSRS